VDELVKYFFDGGNPGNEVMIESFRERVGRVRGMWWLVWWWRGSEGWRWLCKCCLDGTDGVCSLQAV